MPYLREPRWAETNSFATLIFQMSLQSGLENDYIGQHSSEEDFAQDIHAESAKEAETQGGSTGWEGTAQDMSIVDYNLLGGFVLYNS